MPRKLPIAHAVATKIVAVVILSLLPVAVSGKLQTVVESVKKTKFVVFYVSENAHLTMTRNISNGEKALIFGMCIKFSVFFAGLFLIGHGHGKFHFHFPDFQSICKQ